MTLNSPIEFAEALARHDVRKVVGTAMSSRELSELPVAVRERAFFSARTMNESYLEEIQKRVRAILNPRTVIDETGRPRTEGLDFASARAGLKEILRGIGYSPEPDEAGTLKDLGSDQRLNLVVETNVEMAQGFGQWKQGQDPELLDLYPAQELFRAEARDEERRWLQVIWPEAAAAVGDMGAMSAVRFGRMVARKDSPIWVEISDFGQPYPPFKFNSGMWTRDVTREEAVRLGAIEEADVVSPTFAEFETLKAA